MKINWKEVELLRIHNSGVYKRALEKLIDDGIVSYKSGKNWKVYELVQQEGFRVRPNLSGRALYFARKKDALDYKRVVDELYGSGFELERM